MQGMLGAFRASNWADLKGTFGPWSLLGMASKGFARQRGAGVLVGFVSGAKKMLLFPWTKGLVPQKPDPIVGGCVQQVLEAAGRGSRGCSPCISGQGMPVGCRSPCGVGAYAEGLPDMGVPNPQSPFSSSSSSFLSPSSRFPRPGGPWLI